MHNPFEQIDEKQARLEELLLDIKQITTGLMKKAGGQTQTRMVDLRNLLKARPILGSRSTVYKLVASGSFPHSKLGNRLIFDLEAIDKWLMDQKVDTLAEREAQLLDYMRSNKKRRHAGLPK